MKTVITSQAALMPPPFPLDEMGEGRVGVKHHKMDEEIDQRVYVLYGLTEEEIKIIEGK